MHYYQFNIGDYLSHTRHLTIIQDACYRRLLDYYYLHESPIPNDIPAIARKLMLNECLTDVEQVLNEFFTLVENVWINPRADIEIAAYSDKKRKASEAGKASAAARSSKVEPALNERSTDVQLNNKHKTMKYAPPIPDGLLADYLKVRKAKRAGELTETAFKGLETEAAKAGITVIEAIEICCRKGWAGFDSTWDWGKPKSNKPTRVAL